MDTTNQAVAPEQELTEEGQQLLKLIQQNVGKILEAIQGEMVAIGSAACVEAAIVVITHPSTPPQLRAQLAPLLMAHAHELSAIVSQEQADGPMTAEQSRPSIILQGA